MVVVLPAGNESTLWNRPAPPRSSVSCLPDAKGVHAWHVEARGVCNPTVAEPHREFSAKGCAIKLNKGGEAESLPLSTVAIFFIFF
jgi:hypothetical protein